VERVETALRALGHKGPLATHPARLLAASLLEKGTSGDEIRPVLAALARDLAAISTCEPLTRENPTMAELLARHRLARRATPLVAAGLGALLEPSFDSAKAFRSAVALVEERDTALAAASKSASGWRDPLAADDASRALVLAKKY
jgi:hypothetical protein